jgi:hypothetical protein
MNRIKRLRLSLWLVITAFSFYSVCYIGLNALASSKHETTSRAWSRTLFDLSSIPVRFPKTEANATARMLDEVLKEHDNRFNLTAGAKDAPWAGSWSILHSQLDTPSDSIFLPNDVKDYLSLHATAFQLIYDQIHRQAPQWETNVEKLIDAPVPQISSIQTINNLIALDVLNKTEQNKTKEALEAFEASWKITESLRNRPELLSQLIAMHINSVQAKLLRKMKDVPQEWQERIMAHDYRKSVIISYAVDVWGINETLKRRPADAVSDPKSGGAARLLENIVVTAGGPYFDLCGAESLETVRRNVVKLQHDISTRNYNTGKQKLNDVSEWNIFGNVFIPNINGIWREVHETMLLCEATQKLLRVKEKKENKLPIEPSDMESSFLNNSHWIYTKEANDTFSLTFDRELKFLADKDDNPLSLTWTIR